jgi:urease accessory protein
MPTATLTATEHAGATLDVVLRDGRSVVGDVRAAGPLALRRLRDERDGVLRLAVVQTAAMLVDGDDVALDVRIGPGAALVLVDVSATLAHPMRGAGARQRLSVHAAAGSRVVIAEQPLIVAAGARVRREVRIALDPGARLLHRETLVLGRHGEPGGALHARTRVTRAGRPLLDETLDSGDADVLASAAVLGGARVIASVGLFGVAADPGPPGGTFALGPEDRLLRRLAADTSGLGSIDAQTQHWQAALSAG